MVKIISASISDVDSGVTLVKDRTDITSASMKHSTSIFKDIELGKIDETTVTPLNVDEASLSVSDDDTTQALANLLVDTSINPASIERGYSKRGYSKIAYVRAIQPQREVPSKK